MDFGGYTGSGIWLILAVLAFNLACIPAWFLVNHLRRTHDFEIKKAKTFLFLLDKEREGKRKEARDPELLSAVEDITASLDKAEGLGPLWGRKHVTLVRLGILQVSNRWPELSVVIHDAMQRGGGAAADTPETA